MENMTIGKDNDDVLVHCREYRSLRQRKEWEFKGKCLQNIKQAYINNKSSMWSVLNVIDRENKVVNEPSGEELYRYFKSLSDADNTVYIWTIATIGNNSKKVIFLKYGLRAPVLAFLCLESEISLTIIRESPSRLS